MSDRLPKDALASIQAQVDGISNILQDMQRKQEAFLADAQAIAMDGEPVTPFNPIKPLDVRFYDWCADSAVGFSRWSYNTIKSLAVWIYDGLAIFGEFMNNAIIAPIADMLLDLFIWIEKGMRAAWSRVKDFYNMHGG